MLTTIIIAGLLGLTTILLAVRELRLYRVNKKRPTPLFQYSRRRVLLRLIGLGDLLAMNIMFVAGLHLIDFAKHPNLFPAYWGFFGVLVIGLFVIAILDFRETYRNLLEAHRQKRDEESDRQG